MVTFSNPRSLSTAMNFQRRPKSRTSSRMVMISRLQRHHVETDFHILSKSTTGTLGNPCSLAIPDELILTDQLALAGSLQVQIF